MSELKPCPFCGCSMKLSIVGRDWFRIEPVVWHLDECPIDDQTFDYSQSSSASDAVDMWNMRN